MSDSAFKTAAFPAYTTEHLRSMIAEPFVNAATKVAMGLEVERREKVAAGDVSVMTDGERLRAYKRKAR